MTSLVRNICLYRPYSRAYLENYLTETGNPDVNPSGKEKDVSLADSDILRGVRTKSLKGHCNTGLKGPCLGNNKERIYNGCKGNNICVQKCGEGWTCKYEAKVKGCPGFHHDHSPFWNCVPPSGANKTMRRYKNLVSYRSGKKQGTTNELDELMDQILLIKKQMKLLRRL